MNNKMNKNIVPEDFTLKLSLVDSLPVIFFGLTSIILGISINSFIFIIGAIITFLSGLLKVIWKMIVALKKRNIWVLFIQMRIFMPLGFLVMIIGFVLKCINNDMSIFFNSLLNPFSLVFLIIGLLGMVLMVIFSIKLDSSNLKSNWIEQICNAFSQLSFFIGFLLAFLLK